MLRFKSQAAVAILLLVLISCTIIKDSDLTSKSQLDKLTLKSFEIVQNSQVGNSSALAVLKYDSVVNRISAGTGAHVSKVKGFALPVVGNYKMKLKSGTTAATEIAIGYKDNGKPNAFAIYKGDSAVEIYKFFYNSSDQLIKFVVDIDPVDNLPELLHIKDTIIYPVGNVYPSSIIRKSSDPTLVGTFTMQTCNNCSGSSNQSISPIVFNQAYQINFNPGGDCNSNGDSYIYSCGGVTRASTSGGGGSQNGNQNQLSFVNNFTFNKTIQTTLTSASNTDIYYFHPIMIVKDLIPEGSFYFWFYSVDWFQTSGNSSSNSDMVKINLNYAH